MRDVVQKSARCATRTETSATANVSAPSDHACGTARETTSIADMATSSAKRTGARSALTLLVSHAYATQAHHTVASTTSPRTARARSGPQRANR